MDIDSLFDMPGGDDFEDVTDVFDRAAEEMEPDEVLLTDGFTLLDSMGAFEIGEPRMDSGMILEQDQRPPFDPLNPLLSEEVCWILDRSFACEMEWHAGNTLSQTVYTLLHVHHMADIDPDFLLQYPMNDDANRPLGLITIVLRAGILGILKSCDMSWRELSKGRVQDTEDWQSEKCDISLMEGVPSEYASQKLSAACAWLHSSPIPTPQRDALIDRLLLRKVLLDLFRLDLSTGRDRLRQLTVIAQNALHKILSSPPTPEPSPESPARLCLDPHITRRLPNFIPTRVVPLPPQEEVWKTISVFIHGWIEVERLLDSPTLSAWELAGCNIANSPQRPPPPPYIRSLTQSAFFDRSLFLYQFPPSWLVERFFLETIGVPWSFVRQLVQHGLRDVDRFDVAEIDRQLGKTLLQHVRSHWFSPPRRRRYRMKSLVDWLALHDFFRQLSDRLSAPDDIGKAVISVLPYLPILWQLSTALDIIISGFKQELYAGDERAVAYWYAAQVIDLHLDVLEKVKPVVPRGTPTHIEMIYQIQYLRALQKVCMAMFYLTAPQVRQSPDRISLNFRRRYKWLFTKTFPHNVEEQVLPVPDLDVFLQKLERVRGSGAVISESLVSHTHIRYLKANPIYRVRKR
ncbi:hypothetical protein K474DRAFT_1587725 [Panus rudis PR-1116 ss-1]|nr:hypothetical protein K474DRAFT_1587725 [Panus rudis PR-1116 ss-1]